MSRWGNFNDGIKVLPPGKLEQLIIGIQKDHCQKWNFEDFNRDSQLAFSHDFRLADFKTKEHLIEFLEYCQILQLIRLYKGGMCYTNRCSAVSDSGEPCDAREDRAVLWSLTGGIRKIGSNLTQYFCENIPAFEHEYGWVGVLDKLMELEEWMKERLHAKGN